MWDGKLLELHPSVFHSWEQQLTDGYVERQMGLIDKTWKNVFYFAAIEYCSKQQFSLINKCYCFCSFTINSISQKCIIISLSQWKFLSVANINWIGATWDVQMTSFSKHKACGLFSHLSTIRYLTFKTPSLFQDTYLSLFLTWVGVSWHGGRHSAVECCAGRTLRM